MNKQLITEERLEKFQRVARSRQRMTVILENVHDIHNIGAVLRTCDSVGIQEVFIIYSDPRLQGEKLTKIKASSTGAKKWLDVHVFENVPECLEVVRSRYDTLLATHLNEASVNIYEEDLTSNVALMFGNEHIGLTEELLGHADFNVNIPQYGMVNSLNISVACAVMLYEASRQRAEKGLYSPELDTPHSDLILNKFVDIHNRRYLEK